MPTPGTQTSFDKSFHACVQIFRKQGLEGVLLIDALRNAWMNGLWPDSSVGHNLNVLDEALGTGAFEQAMENLEQETFQEADQIFEQVETAAQEHAIANGDILYQIGDLEIVVQRALRIMSPEQREILLRCSEISDWMEEFGSESPTN